MILPPWREASAWRYHTPEFVRIGFEREAPILELDSAAKVALYDVLPYWLRLSLHPNLLAPIAPGEHGMIVHYAALAWTRDRTNARRTFVKWALQIVDAYRVVVRDTPPDHVGLFMRPVVKIDVGHRVRIGFLPLDEDGRQLAEMPREIRARWPRCDERALVYLIGTLLARMSEVEDTDVQQLIARASASASRRRFANLQQLAEALRALVDVTAIPSRNEWVAWQHFERAVGLLELERPKLALEWFERALALDRDLMVAQEGIELIGAVLGLVRERRPRPSPVERPLQLRPVSELWSSLPAHVPWAEIEPRGVALERERDFRGALDLYRRAANDVRTNVALFTARARCHLELDETGEAIDYAQRALSSGAAHAPALEVLVAAMLRKAWHEEALRNAERLVELEPTSGRAHHLLGKALFACGRMPEARDAFERATSLDPKLLEAQLMRREVERVTGNVRRSVGSQHAPTIEIPPQLAELRDILVSGNTGAAISALRDPRFAHDADAKLLLARFLAFDERWSDAIALYDELEATSHRTAALVGKATALLAQGRPGDALSIFEQLPDDADAAEGQARALEALGRLDEAAEAYRRFIALASSGSELRVRAAQLWLASR